MHTYVLIHTSLSDCCYRAGCTLSQWAPSVTSQWQLRRTMRHHTPASNKHPSASGLTHCHQPYPLLLLHPTTPHSPHPLFLSLFLYLTFSLMSCNTDNEPDDLPLIRLSLACLVIDPQLSLQLIIWASTWTPAPGGILKSCTIIVLIKEPEDLLHPLFYPFLLPSIFHLSFHFLLPPCLLPKISPSPCFYFCVSSSFPLSSRPLPSSSEARGTERGIEKNIKDGEMWRERVHSSLPQITAINQPGQKLSHQLDLKH